MMLYRAAKGLLALAMLAATTVAAAAFDDAKYPNLKGAWHRTLAPMPRFDPSKPRGLAQQPPLTPEYRALFEASLADQAAGGQGTHTVYRCLPWGMPAMMNGYAPIEVTVLPDVTYLFIDDGNDSVRRVFTDGRDWPEDPIPTFTGYSIGRWVDTNDDGRYDLLEVETRHFKGPRVYDNSGLSLHADNESIIKERIYLTPSDPNILRDEITVVDHGLRHPWSVVKEYRRDARPNLFWEEDVCAEANPHVHIGNEAYMLSADGYLMPAKKDQAPPNLRYFRPRQAVTR
jgi:hypothetical protein